MDRMNSSSKNRVRIEGIGLVELMVTILLLVSVVAAGLSYQYYTALAARSSDLHITACRVGMTLLEAWKAQGAGADFAPLEAIGSELVITDSASIEPPAALANVLGSYIITAARANYFVTLSYQDAADEPRLVNVTVAWAQRNCGQAAATDADKSFSWTTYEGY